MTASVEEVGVPRFIIFVLFISIVFPKLATPAINAFLATAIPPAVVKVPPFVELVASVVFEIPTPPEIVNTPVVLDVEEVVPVILREVPEATPKTGVTKDGLVDKTTDPEPVLVVVPVPPFKTGRAVPDKESEIVPFDVRGDPETAKKDGTDKAIEVIGEVQVIAVAPPPPEVKTCPEVPDVVGKL